MAAFGKGFQPMNFAWQIARKIDRLDMGEYTTRARLNNLVVIYGLVRAINPVEDPKDESTRKKDEGEKFRSVTDIISLMAERRKKLRDPENKMKMNDSDLGQIDSNIENELDGFWDDLAEVIFRCKITDSVRPQEETAP
jgi:hypothetical protein